MGRPSPLHAGPKVVTRAIVLAAAVVVLAACGGDGEAGSAPPLGPGRVLAAAATIEPTTHLFGDTVIARVDVALDKSRVDPDSVKIDVRFAPYERITTKVTRREGGDLVELRYMIPLRCLEQRCVPSLASLRGTGGPPTGRSSYQFPPGQVTARGGGQRHSATIQFPPVQVTMRLNEAEIGASLFPYKASTKPPAPSYSAAPRALMAGSIVGALLLLAWPALLTRNVVRERRAAREAVDVEPEITPRQRALSELEWALAQTGGNRRRGLERAAGTLEEAGKPALAREARTLAWSPPQPEAALVERLREEVSREA